MLEELTDSQPGALHGVAVPAVQLRAAAELRANAAAARAEVGGTAGNEEDDHVPEDLRDEEVGGLSEEDIARRRAAEGGRVASLATADTLESVPVNVLLGRGGCTLTLDGISAYSNARLAGRTDVDTVGVSSTPYALVGDISLCPGARW
jgi:hypothetical protein